MFFYKLLRKNGKSFNTFLVLFFENDKRRVLNELLFSRGSFGDQCDTL